MKFILLLSFIGFCVAEVDLNSIPLPNIDEVAVIKDRCEKKGGAGTYEKVKEAKTELQTCIQNMFNITQIKIEIEESQKTGSMDEVFGKYCKKRPEVSTCLYKFTDTIKPCLEDTEKDALNLTLNIAKELGEFICHKDGDRIAMFVAEGGVECIKAHTEGIQKCVNQTIKFDASSAPNALPNLLIDKQKCNDLDNLQTCIVEELEKCEESTPANVVDALIKFIKKAACKGQGKQRKRSIFKRSSITDTFNSDTFKNKIMDILKKKCEQNGTPNSFSNLENSMNKVTPCLRKLGALGSTKDEGFENITGKLHGCLDDTLKIAKSCLPPSEQFYPDFYFEQVNALTEYSISMKNKIGTKEWTMELIHCFQNYKQNEANLNDIKKCLPQHDNDPITKASVCEKFNETRACATNSINKVCIRDIEVQQYVNGLFDAFLKPCLN